MSHARIRNPELYADRTVQDWHFDALPPAWTAIDVDLMGVCEVGFCRAPLYLIEASTNGENKSTNILRALAQAADVRALLIVHEAGEIVRWSSIHPASEPFDPTADGLRAHIFALRYLHHKQHHPQRMNQFTANANRRKHTERKPQ